jgi:hypothetical protein
MHLVAANPWVLAPVLLQNSKTSEQERVEHSRPAKQPDGSWVELV